MLKPSLKPLLAIIIAILLCLSGLPSVIHAEEDYKEDTFEEENTFEENISEGNLYENIDDGLPSSKISPAIKEEVSRIVDGFIAPNKKDIEKAEEIKVFTDKTVKTAIKDKIKEDTETTSEDICAYKVKYLISFSMPEKTIINLLNDAVAINTSCSKYIVTIGIRGFVGGSLKKTIKHLARISDTIHEDLPLTIDTDTFRRYKVEKIPFIIIERDDFKKIVHGDASIDYAVKQAPNNELSGMTYPIMEEDFSATIEKKKKEIMSKLKNRIDNKIDKKIYAITKYSEHFKKADKDRTFFLDPSYLVEEDITAPDGSIIARKGTVINPYEYVSLGKYIVIDGDDDEEVAFALQENFKKIILISGDPIELSKKYFSKYKVKFYTANDIIVYGLSLNKTPSIIEQDGGYIRVTEKKIKR